MLLGGVRGQIEQPIFFGILRHLRFPITLPNHAVGVSSPEECARRAFVRRFFQLLNFRLALFVTDNWKIVSHIAEINKQIWSFMGLVYLGLSFLWLIYGEANSLLQQAFVVVGLSAYVWRLIKAWRACLQANLEWYYLILYLCALEILPILFVWRWLSGEYN